MAEESDAANSGIQEQGIFAPLLQAQTYLNMAHHLLALPLGIFYFVFLITGLSVGFSLIVVVVGIFILLLVLAASWGLCAFEREMAIHMLGATIPPMARQEEPEKGIWARLRAYLSSPVTWKGLLYLFARFPLGIFTFTVTVTLVSTAVGLIAAPFAYAFWRSTENYLESRWWPVDTLGEALFAAVVGVGVGLLSAHLINWMGYASGWFATVMLGDPKAAPEGATVGPKPITWPGLKLDAQTRLIGGVTLIGLGALIFIGQLAPQVDRWLGPLALMAIGAALLVPFARKRSLKTAASAGGKPEG